MNPIRLLLARLNKVWSQSIRRQLVWSFSLVTLSIILGCGYLLFSYQRNFLYMQGTESAFSLAHTLSFSSGSKVLSEDLAGLQDVMKGARQTRDINFALVISPQGEILASSESNHIRQHVSDSNGLRLLSLKPEPQILQNDSSLVDVAVPIITGKQHAGWVRVEMSRDTANANLRGIAAAGLGLSFFLLLVITLISTRLAKRLTSGLDRLAKVATDAKEGKPFDRLDMERVDEIGVLARHLYRMLDTIDEEKNENIINNEHLRRESEKNLALLHNASDGIHILDTEGNIIEASDSICALLGYQRNEVIGMNASRWDAKFIGVELTDVVKNLYLQQGRSQFETLHKRKDGTIIDVEVSSFPLELGGKAVLFCSSRDITERRTAEQALQRSNVDLERFAYSVSHDMRQPLRAVSGHLQLLKLGLKDKLDEDNRENLDFAVDGARRMDSMIVSLLDYSRIGRKTESKKWMASRESLDEAISFLAPLIAETQTEVRVGGEWPQVFGSRDELTRLFQNLINNAIKFREPEHPALVEIDSVVKGDIWHVNVRDHGIGINPTQIDRLFQFFSRLQARTRFEGTGMGLALCKRIVEHHDGCIWVESAGEDKGSVFCFEFPLKIKDI